MRDHLQNFAQQLIADRVIELNNNISTPDYCSMDRCFRNSLNRWDWDFNEFVAFFLYIYSYFPHEKVG